MNIPIGARVLVRPHEFSLQWTAGPLYSITQTLHGTTYKLDEQGQSYKDIIHLTPAEYNFICQDTHVHSEGDTLYDSLMKFRVLADGITIQAVTDPMDEYNTLGREVTLSRWSLRETASQMWQLTQDDDTIVLHQDQIDPLISALEELL